jgi:hypothetical protein
MIECIIDIINDAICDIVKGAAVNGLAATMYRTTNDGKQQQIPAIVSKSGEGKYIGLDDTYPAQIYHRLNSIAANLVARSGYGDAAADYRNVYNLSMIVYLNRRRSQMLPDDFVLMIQNKLPSNLSIDAFKNISVIVTAVNLNEQNVFNGEYSNTDFKTSPDCNLFSITYTIDAVYQKQCVHLCACK